MCIQCYSYIYDFILTPLSVNHLLRGYIDLNAFRRCSNEVTHCISRALRDYVKDDILIGCFKLFRETYSENQKILEMIESSEIPKECREHNYDEFIWIKFKETHAEEFKELNHAIEICMDNMVVKKVKCKEQLLEHFFMHKLNHLLHFLPDIHKEHTEKKGFDNGRSLGSVPQDKINHVRRMAGLSVNDEVCISMYSIDTLYD